MLTLDHRPYIRIRPAKCRIDAGNPPGRYKDYNHREKINVQEFIDAAGREEESNEPINEYICANEKFQLSPNSDHCADADSGQESELLPSELSDCDHNHNDCAEEPVNLLNLIPTFYWDYPYICPGQRAYRQNHYLR